MNPIKEFARRAAKVAKANRVPGFRAVRKINPGVVRQGLEMTDENGCHPLALAIRQPHAELILRRLKKLENRVWNMPHATGWFYLYASPARSNDYYRDGLAPGYDVAPKFMMDFPSRKEAQTGGIIGAFHISEWVNADSADAADPFFIGPYAAVITDVRRLPFTPVQGRLGFFRVDVPKL